jgi:hypothetical protein
MQSLFRSIKHPFYCRLDIRGAAIFSKRLPWVKKVHSAYLKVWALLPDGKVYELTFECKALEPMPKHSGIVTK